MDTLDYAKPERHRAWWKGLRWACLVVSPLVLALLTLSVPFSEVETRMDSVTGSWTRRTTWLNGLFTTTSKTASPLEEHLKSNDITWRANWGFLHRTSYNLLGQRLVSEHGSGPPIYLLQPGMQNFVDRSTDAQLIEFIRIMETGSADQQQEAIDAASAMIHEVQSPAAPTGSTDERQ